MQPITPIDDFVYLVNHVLLGEEPTIEDFILLVGTLVAFIAFILWCCFPIQPKESSTHRQFSCKSMHRQQHQQNAASSMDSINNSTVGSGFLAAGFCAAGNAGNVGGIGGSFGNKSNANANATGVNSSNNYIGNNRNNSGSSNNNNNSSNSASTYSRSPPSSLHNDYIRSGHHCCS